MTTTNSAHAGAVSDAQWTLWEGIREMRRSNTRTAVREAILALEQFASSLYVLAANGQTDTNYSVAYGWRQDALTDLYNATLVNRDSALQQMLLDAYVLVAGIDIE